MATIAPEVEAELGSVIKADDRAALEKDNALLRAEINDLQSKITTTIPFKGTTTSGLEVDMDAVVEVETDVFLYIFTELMRPGTATVLSVPECTKMFGQITRSDCITFAKGFGYLSKSTPDNGDVVGEFF
ncbi:hypothetical protein TrLO_g2077 [Triparma laevis f. longispina]|uniref:Uncharacterized protein n=1 Tax=Triparma laevis f. longispina TaxID=1714387 RepID=A0A9W7KYQ0_9STRA|nr:hypothetical protein TrLO_g2077 [Triparma laevis f. longispina]